MLRWEYRHFLILTFLSPLLGIRSCRVCGSTRSCIATWYACRVGVCACLLSFPFHYKTLSARAHGNDTHVYCMAFGGVTLVPWDSSTVVIGLAKEWVMERCTGVMNGDISSGHLHITVVAVVFAHDVLLPDDCDGMQSICRRLNERSFVEEAK